jgi:Carbohydrate esterase, sialic acid-specific acetylesterase
MVARLIIHSGIVRTPKGLVVVMAAALMGALAVCTIPHCAGIGRFTDDFLGIAPSRHIAAALNERNVHQTTAQQSQPPLQIVILAGQSNMVGMGSMEHLDLLVHGNFSDHDGRSNDTNHPSHDAGCCNPYRVRLYNETTGSYRVSDRVYVKFGRNATAQPLTANPDSGFASRGCFGPELMIGWTLHDGLLSNSGAAIDPQSTFLLIKTAWGGRSLAVDFRPPSSEPANYSADLKPMDYGRYYREMVEDVLETLHDLPRHVPHYDPKSSTYRLVGLVWFQGWNDVISWPYVEEYGSNLRNLVRDVRRDLSAPDLPVVVGELGQDGTVLDPRQRATPRVLAMRTQQHAVTLLPEFVNTTRYVPTARYVVPSRNGTTHYYNGDYHYGGRADTFFHIGQAMGRAVEELAQGRASVEMPNSESSNRQPNWINSMTIILRSIAMKARRCYAFDL